MCDNFMNNYSNTDQYWVLYQDEMTFGFLSGQVFFFCASIKFNPPNKHSQATLCPPCYFWVGPPFRLQNLNPSCHRFNKVLETFLRDFGPYWRDIITSCCRFVSCTSMMRTSSSTNVPKVLLDWYLETVEDIWVQWTHYHVLETSLRWFFMTWSIILREVSIRRWSTVVMKEWRWSADL